MVNLWEDLETGPDAPDEIYAVVECLKGERNKYEYDKDVPGVVLDRVLHSNVHYPYDYGFIPQSYYDDEDPFEIYAVVECLKGERNKYEYDKDIPGVVLDRVLHSNVHYPYDYGFIPQSYYDDEDPFDVMVLVEDQTFPGCVVEARPVALMKMDDDGEQDDKVIAVPTEDPRFDHIEDLDDIPQQTLDEIDEFFATYKNLEAGKEVETLGWEDKAAAKEAIEHAQELYDEQFA